MKLPNITYTGDLCRYIENSEVPFECISYNKDREYFSDYSAQNKFIKSVEKVVRTSLEYKMFVAHIKNNVGLNFCQISSSMVDVESGGGVTIEMHHGPLFSLYDYVAIILEKEIHCGNKITTFRIANKVIEEHFAGRVQVVMLSITNHEAVHNRDVFLNVRQGYGNISAFIDKYSPYLSDDQKYRIYNYINLCKENDSFDISGVLDTVKVSKMIKFD